MKWERIHPRHRLYARKLRKALRSAVDMHLSGKWGAKAIQATALRDYEGEFGYSITPRHLARVWALVLERAGSSKDRLRSVETYLPKRISGKKGRSQFDAESADLPNLACAVCGIGDPAEVTEQQLDLVWDAAFCEMQRLIGNGAPRLRAQQRVIDGLANSGLELAANAEALRVTFRRRLARWKDGGMKPSAVRDRRLGSERRGILQVLTDDDRKLLIARSLQGGIAKAWRECIADRLLSDAVLARYLDQPANKSYVPQAIRDLVTPDVNMLRDIHHGPRIARLNGAHVSRDWSDEYAGDWYQADDTTLPLYYWEDGEDGRPRLMRGQTLIMCDCRSLRVLAFAIHSERNYTAKVIRRLILETHDKYGLPNKGFYFENGIWKHAKIIKGGSGVENLPPEETELGLREFGIRFMHATPGNARAKVIEGVLGILQRRMEDQPGYCGRNEMIEKFERVQRAKLDVEAGRSDPSESFLHKSQWNERLAAICDEYNNEHQDGKLLRGLSPRKLWDSHFETGRKLTRLTPETKYLLFNHRRPLKVTRNGICIQIGRERHWFRDAVTGSLVGRVVQTYFDPEKLDCVYITEKLGAGSAHVIPAVPVVPAMSASREQLRAAMESVNSHNRPAKALYQAIEPHFPKNSPSPFRRVDADSESVEFGQEIAAEKEALREAAAAEVREERKLSRLKRRFGARGEIEGVSKARQLKGLTLIERAEALEASARETDDHADA